MAVRMRKVMAIARVKPRVGVRVCHLLHCSLEFVRSFFFLGGGEGFFSGFQYFSKFEIDPEPEGPKH